MYHNNPHRFDAGKKALRDALQALWQKHPDIRCTDAKKETPANLAGYSAYFKLKDHARLWKIPLEPLHVATISKLHPLFLALLRNKAPTAVKQYEEIVQEFWPFLKFGNTQSNSANNPTVLSPDPIVLSPDAAPRSATTTNTAPRRATTTTAPRSATTTTAPRSATTTTAPRSATTDAVTLLPAVGVPVEDANRLRTQLQSQGSVDGKMRAKKHDMTVAEAYEKMRDKLPLLARMALDQTEVPKYVKSLKTKGPGAMFTRKPEAVTKIDFSTVEGDEHYDELKQATLEVRSQLPIWQRRRYDPLVTFVFANVRQRQEKLLKPADAAANLIATIGLLKTLKPGKYVDQMSEHLL